MQTGWLQEGAELQIRDMIRVLMKAVLFSTKAKKGHDDNVLEEKNVQGQFSSLPDITI